MSLTSALLILVVPRAPKAPVAILVGAPGRGLFWFSLQPSESVFSQLGFVTSSLLSFGISWVHPEMLRSKNSDLWGPLGQLSR